MCNCVDVSDGFNLTQTGEHQFQFLDVVTSSITPDDVTPHAVTGAAHYYASLPPPPPPMYVFIDQSSGIYTALPSATVGAATALSTSGYVAPVAPLMTPQMQSAGVVLPPGVIPAAAAQTLLRPGLLQQPQPASVIMPAPTGILPPPTSIIPSHGRIRPLPHSIPEMPVPAIRELALNANAGYSGQPLIAAANDLAFNSMPVDMHIGASLTQHDGGYISSGGCNVNNSAAEHAVPPHLDDEHSATELVVSLDRDEQTESLNPDAVQFEYPLNEVVSGHGNSLATYENCTSSNGGVELQEAAPMVADSQPEVAPVNGELSVDSSHELGSLSETSSVTSPSSLVADMTLIDHAGERDVCVVSAKKDHSYSPVMTACTQQSLAMPACVSPPSTAIKPKVSSWASLLKDTTTATNAIVINMNDSHAAVAQLKADVKTAAKEPVASQSTITHVSNGEKLKLEISGLYATSLPLGIS